jgi:Tol biopolymer transport system component
MLAIAVIAGTALGTSALNRAFQPVSGGWEVAFVRFLRGCPEHLSVSGALEVFAVDVASGEERLVSHVATWPEGSYRSEDWPDFSPDGEEYAWVDHYRRELYVTDVRTGETRKLTSGLEVGPPHFSPDGTRILFQSGAEEGPVDLERDDQILEDAGEIYVVGLDGSAPVKITNGHLPTWTSDGRIAFARSRWTVNLRHDGDAIHVRTTPLPTRFFLMDPDGSDLEQVYEAPGDAQIGDAEWSPDGDRIAAEVTMHGNTDVYVLDLDTRIPLRLTDAPAEDTSPTWSPDGSFIAFHTGRWGTFTGHSEIAMIPAAGGAVTRLTHDACFRDSDPTWVPDPAAVASLPVWTPPPPPKLGDPGTAEGRDILFQGETEDVWDLFALDPATGKVTDLTADPPDQLSPEVVPGSHADRLRQR